MAGYSLSWVPIPANSPVIQYTGEWDFNNYKPRRGNFSASMNFTGSGVALAASGNAGQPDNGGLLFNVDPVSDDSYASSLALSFTPGGRNGNRWVEQKLPPGEHVVKVNGTDGVRNVTFLGFEVEVNVTLPYNATGGVDFYTWNKTLDVDYVIPFGREDTVDDITYYRGDRGGFAFNFTGAGITVNGQDTFTQATNYSVWFNVSDVPSTVGLAPYAQYRAEAGRGGVLFFAGALPPGNHRVMILKDHPPGVEKYDDLGFKNATVYYPDLHSNSTEACFSSCGSAQSDRGKGVGVSYDQQSGVNRKVGWSAGLAVAGFAAGMALLV